MAVLLVTHDLGVMSSVAGRVSIFYAGRVVESGPTREVLRGPRHPYTKQLLLALPDPAEPTGRSGRSPVFRRPRSRGRPGCAFHPRCNWAETSCSVEVPAPCSDQPGAGFGLPRRSACRSGVASPSDHLTGARR